MSAMSDRESASPADGMPHPPPGDEQLAVAAGVFALLADQTRLHVLWLLAQGEADVSQLTASSGAARTAVSQHLAKLRLAGLVQARRDGRRAVYSLRDGHLRRLVLEAIGHADHQVTGKPWHS